jgi:hypothetical protein
VNPAIVPSRTAATGTPHASSQTDVYYAGNGYLLGTSMPTQDNYHRNPNFFEDSCVACHVDLFPADSQPLTKSNHSFAVDANTCVKCHGPGVELKQRQIAVANLSAAYQVKLAQVFRNAGITFMGTGTSFKTAAAGGLVKAADGTVTATVTAHGFVTGDQVYVGPGEAGFNSGYYIVTLVGADTFTYNDGLAGPATNAFTQSFMKLVAVGTRTIVSVVPASSLNVTVTLFDGTGNTTITTTPS